MSENNSSAGAHANAAVAGPGDSDNENGPNNHQPEAVEAPGNVTATLRSKRRRSPLWDHFTYSDEPKYVLCRHCNNKVCNAHVQACRLCLSIV